MFLPWGIVLAWLQYSTLFRRNEEAPLILAILGFLIVAFVIFALIATLYEYVHEDPAGSDDSFVGLVFSISAILTMFFLLSGVQNVRRYRSLKTLLTATRATSLSKQGTWRMSPIFLTIVAVTVCAGGTLGYFCGNQTTYAEDLDSVPWLPESASQISYYKSYGRTVCEFNMPLKEFLKWAEEENWEVEKITEPLSMQRYTYYLTDSDTQIPERQVELEPQSVTVDSGHHCVKEIVQGHTYLEVIYNEANSKVYYCWD